MVSEIVSRTTEVCQLFKMLQFPNGTPMAKKISEDRRKRLTDVHTILVSHFRTLNAIHTRLQDLPDPNIRVRPFLKASLRIHQFWLYSEP